MKTKLLIAAVALSVSSFAMASPYSSTTYGNTTYTTGSSGTTTSTTYGNTTYHSGAVNGSSTSYGNTTYHNIYD
jgi:hypothetical protein